MFNILINFFWVFLPVIDCSAEVSRLIVDIFKNFFTTFSTVSVNTRVCLKLFIIYLRGCMYSIKKSNILLSVSFSFKGIRKFFTVHSRNFTCLFIYDISGIIVSYLVSLREGRLFLSCSTM
jgi:hypothetical protein